VSDTCARCEFTDYMQAEHGDWENVAYYVSEHKQSQFGNYEVVDWFHDPTPVDGRGYYGENCHPQGHEGEVWMVFKTDDGRFFKVYGTSDSYGNCRWMGTKEVVGKVVQKVVYEFKEV